MRLFWHGSSQTGGHMLDRESSGTVQLSHARVRSQQTLHTLRSQQPFLGLLLRHLRSCDAGASRPSRTPSPRETRQPWRRARQSKEGGAGVYVPDLRQQQSFVELLLVCDVRQVFASIGFIPLTTAICTLRFQTMLSEPHVDKITQQCSSM